MIDLAPLQGRWTVVSYRVGEEMVDPEKAEETDLTIDGSHLSGTMGVNRLIGEIGTSFPLGPIATTMMAGPDPLMRQERALLQHLGSADVLEATGEGMIASRDGLALIEFRRVGNQRA